MSISSSGCRRWAFPRQSGITPKQFLMQVIASTRISCLTFVYMIYTIAHEEARADPQTHGGDTPPHARQAPPPADIEVGPGVLQPPVLAWRQEQRDVSDEQCDIYAEAIDGYARFMRLVEEYVDLMTGITEEEAARAKDDE